jgi:uncharacterized damage-inducible protein DinB
MATRHTKKRTPARASTTKKARKKTPHVSAQRARPTGSAETSSPKRQFLDALTSEHATTLKVMRAFPADKGAFQPHPRSQSAKRLMWTFVQEQAVVVGALKGTLKMPPTLPPEPATLAEVFAAYERGAKEVSAAVTGAADARLLATTPFFTGPRAIGEVPIISVMWLMLMDSVHHRGQLSVYIRMAGGLVPSIYGPSADEPWM